MRTYAGGTQVESGYYINGRSFAFANVPRDGGTLPGQPDAKWLRMPTLVVMAAAPALGGLFVVALPLLGVGLTAYAVARALGGRARKGATEIAATVAAPGLAPGEAHLAGRPPAQDASAEEPAPPAGDALEQDIKDRRAER